MIESLVSEKQLADLKMLLDKAQKIVLTCHVSPDGDAMGALTALLSVLKHQNKEVFAITPNIFPDFLNWLPGVAEVMVYEKNEEMLNPILQTADLFVCLDFNGLSRLSTMETVVRESPAAKIVIDHHLGPEDFASCLISFPQMSSTCELLYRVLVALYGEDMLGYDEAVCLYTGMMTDTGAFTYNSSRSDIYYIIGKLLEKGIDKDKIYRNVFYEYSPERFRLLGYVLYVKMEQLHEYHSVILSLDREEQKRFSHKKGDTEGFVNIPLQIKGNKLSIFLRENTEQDNIRVSLRSVDDFPCNQMAAEFFNGGGHLNAAGGTLECTLDEAIDLAKKAVRKYAYLLK
ncbi:bifunctional oligoribonuclease/PAP phosphatase NrnA [Bacteroides eggerthii]|uniref:Bifunctional oligoribonuclease/PAP phosphatase NrnA n=1 Tax=Bacteroides eggerthii TaxID=28111 RepID=A0ABT7U4R1_9BACE|nr:bifunctional oligoribonuclease/PAP phosphatase NrnA [Bacteroides eggerthii]